MTKLANLILPLFLSINIFAQSDLEISSTAYRVGTAARDFATEGRACVGPGRHYRLHAQERIYSDLKKEGRDLEYECSKVYEVLSVPMIREKTNESWYWYSANVEIFCSPRSYDERLIISLMKSCEKEPVEACFSQEVIERISSVANTEYIYIEKPIDCESKPE